MTKYELGQVVTANGWPSIVIEANRSEKDDARVMCAVFGWEVDMGSVWVRDVRPLDYDAAIAQVDASRIPRFNKIRDEYSAKGAKARAKREAKAAAKTELEK